MNRKYIASVIVLWGLTAMAPLRAQIDNSKSQTSYDLAAISNLTAIAQITSSNLVYAEQSISMTASNLTYITQTRGGGKNTSSLSIAATDLSPIIQAAKEKIQANILATRINLEKAQSIIDQNIYITDKRLAAAFEAAK